MKREYVPKEQTFTLTKTEVTALLSLYTFAYDLLGGKNAPDCGDAPEFKAAKKVFKRINPKINLK